MKETTITTLLLCLGVMTAIPALAQDHGEKPKHKIKGVKGTEGLRPAKARVKETMKARQRDESEVSEESKQAVQELKKDIEERKKLDKAGHDRREALEKKGPKTAEEMRGLDGKGERKKRASEQRSRAKEHLQKYRKGPAAEAVVQQQERHAERMAKFDRIRALATEKGDTKTLARLDKLQAKEEARFQGWLEKSVAAKAGEADDDKADDEEGEETE